MCPDNSSSEVRLPSSLQRLAAGLRAGGGASSQRSLSMIDGERLDLIPIVFSLSPSGGLTRFLTVLGTLRALREESSGERILMLSWGLEREDLKSLLESSLNDGDSGEITFELSIPAEGPNGMSPSTSPKPQITGLSGVPCDRCGQEILLGDSYVTRCDPPHGLIVWHPHCARAMMRAS